MMPTQDKIIVQNRPFRLRLPKYFTQTIPSGPAFDAVQNSIKEFKLNTVCEAAKCPNRTHCYERGTLTFQILGDTCTRSCGFCAEKFWSPNSNPLGPVDPSEPFRVVEAAKKLKLQHVVITSPARDDLKDQGSGQFVAVINHFRKEMPHVTVEVLIPDFQGQQEYLDSVFAASPDIFNHNIETVRRLTPKVRSKATYDRTLFVLSTASAYRPRTMDHKPFRTKSGIMVGHGETREELLQTFQDLMAVGCQMLTLGQYLPPSPHHLPVDRFYTPEEFDQLRQEALQCGFVDVAAGPLVRSSYHADESVRKTVLGT
ncbi:MAG: Lipoyl synthase [Elusimicrobia bacterium]|nr:Lipoyl synthase [Elusimicrobiota bacterium]